MKRGGGVKHDRGRITRRQVTWGGLTLFLGTCVLGVARFFFPRVDEGPGTRNVLGDPSAFAPGVDGRFLDDHGLWVVREEDRLYAILARCTHLGCTPYWDPAMQVFRCPCHGSVFDPRGVNLEGPAPRPLDRMAIELDGRGRVVVDRSRLFGKESWDRPGAVLDL